MPAEYPVPPGFSDFLKSLPPIELARLQHELRKSPEDRLFLDQVLSELKRRETLRAG